VLRFHVLFSSTISAGGGGTRRENATHGVLFALWAGVFADDSSHRPPYLANAGEGWWWQHAKGGGGYYDGEKGEGEGKGERDVWKWVL
ncbi:hypothetical protein Tco_0056876, partial [Tanacetum coccineum]